MSLVVLESVWNSRLHWDAKMVMLVLASEVNDEGEGKFCSLEKLLAHTSLPSSSLEKVLNKLTKTGLICLGSNSFAPRSEFSINRELLNRQKTRSHRNSRCQGESNA